MKFLVTFLFCALALFSSAANADTISIPGMPTYAVSGSDMAGMEVTVTFSGGSTDSGIWAANGIDSGKAFGGDTWSLSFNGADTFMSSWYFTSAESVTSLTINAITGGIVFDILQDKKYTEGSEYGYLDIQNATYLFENPVALGSADPLYDLFGKLTITFAQGATFAAAPFKFDVDTDAVVPEPATMALMGVGLLGLAGVGSRMRKNRK